MKRKYDEEEEEEERENEEKKKQRLSNRSSGSNEASSSTSVVPFERRLEILPPEMMEITPSFDADRIFRGLVFPTNPFENIANEIIGLIASFGVHRELGQINRYLRRLFTITPLLITCIPTHYIPPNNLIFSDHERYELRELADGGQRFDVKDMVLRNPRLTDEAVALLANILSLKTLRIGGWYDVRMKVTGSTFNRLPTSLEELTLNHMVHLTDKSIGNLQHLIKLKKLKMESGNIITGSTFNLLPTSLEELELWDIKNTTDAGIGNLRHLINLKKLKMMRLQLTGSTFNLLPTSLEELELREMKNTTDAGIGNLRHLINLKKLKMMHLQLTGSTFDLLPPLNLEELTLGIIKNLTDAGIANLQYLIELKKLTIVWSGVITGPTFNLLPTSLEELKLENMDSLTDAGIANLQHLTKLKKLVIIGNDKITGSTFNLLPTSLEELELIIMGRITDAGIANLQHLTRLKELIIWNTVVTGTTTFNPTTSNLLPMSLKELRLDNLTNLTNAAVTNLQRLINLKVLSISGCGLLTNHAFDHFPPNLEILKVSECTGIDRYMLMNSFSKMKQAREERKRKQK